MHDHAIPVIYTLIMIATSSIGFYCAARMSGDYPRWVRWIVLSPALCALGVMAAMAQGEHVAYLGDVAFALSLALLYALVASRFSDRPWLDLRTHQHKDEA